MTEYYESLLRETNRIVWNELTKDDNKPPDLAGADLRGVEMSHRNFQGANLAGANLAGVALNHATLIGANLSGANLSGVKAFGANFNSAFVRDTNLSKANLHHSSFDFALIQNTDMRGAFIRHTSIGHTQIKQSNLSGATLYRSYFMSADLSGSNLAGADFQGAVFSDTCYTNTILEPLLSNELVVISGFIYHPIFDTRGYILSMTGTATVIAGCRVFRHLEALSHWNPDTYVKHNGSASRGLQYCQAIQRMYSYLQNNMSLVWSGF